MIPLLDGPKTPGDVEQVLSRFGRTPQGLPRYRLIWSQRKQIVFCGEVVTEYDYLEPCWILERWIAPETAAGAPEMWGQIQEAFMGEYPREGVYFFCQQFTVADPESLRLYCVALEKSRDLNMKERAEGIRGHLQKKEKAQVAETSEAIVELFDSASLGKIQQPVSGPKNNFRTPEDFERDQRYVKDIPNAPKRGGKILKGD